MTEKKKCKISIICFISIHTDDTPNLNAYLERRMTILENSLQTSNSEKNNPVNLMDLYPLGLCGPVMNRGMSIEISHVYLPLSLLTAADKTRSKSKT